MDFLKKFQCEFCNKKFSKQEELMQHQLNVHFKNSPYDCRECKQNFASMEEMRSHLQRKHSYKKEET